MASQSYYVEYPASPDREFACHLCALSFDRNHDLKRHIETHSGERPFVCERGCGKSFTRKDALKRHQAHDIPVLSTGPECETEAETEAGLVSSVVPAPAPAPAPELLWLGRTELSPGGGSGGGIPGEPDLAGALRSTLRQQQYGGMSYPGSSYIAPPPPMHGGEYPSSPTRAFPCDECALSFDRNHDLKRHKMTHAGERPFECHGCGKTFSRKDALKRHQTTKECGMQ
ncbi:unnamed protein product [Mycena citricolor]|uniref:C2H2-type domain-containing protein n=1 Tax=Mycena citricolor TaxID=2018698 RepID=A0AAD2K379_9AGAR|nr:unnamed protein product [Mycena citricolor]CAK5274892.1 unnamed protein product [Mycena citricolor]